MLNVSRWPAGELREVASEIAALRLEREVYELEVFGLTVVPAERTGALDACERAFARVVDLIEARTGTRPDVDGGTTHVDVVMPTLHHVVHEDLAFEELILHPMAAALATMLVGRRAVLAGTEVFMKGPATRPSTVGVTHEHLQLGLHSDNVTVPEPFPTFAQLCNVTWLLSDYTKEDGALAFVPGSHRRCRQPLPGEGAEAVVPVEAPMGSLVVWHGNTWHGSYPRTRPGLRTGLAFALAREYLHPFEPVREAVTDEMVDRNPPRFATLAGRDVIEWGAEGPDYEKLFRRPFRYGPYT